MNDIQYKAFRVEKDETGVFTRTIRTLSTNQLPDNDVLIRVEYSSLNYKDALSAIGNKGVTRVFPHTPGIDAAGIIENSRDSRFSPGQEVIVTSYDLGMNTPGGFGQYIRVPADWVVPLPDGLTLKQSMIYGTAGFTAGLSADRIVQNVDPSDGPVLVTGATGGVGSMAVAVLSRLGYSVTAVSGKKENDFLKHLGAKQIISRKDFLENTDAPLLKAKWAGAVDTVGGDILAAAIKSVKLHGAVTCCGNVASAELPINVFPFILRAVSLFGIGSQQCPMPLRKQIWQNLASTWKIDELDQISNEISLTDLDERINSILKGELKGRTLVNLT